MRTVPRCPALLPQPSASSAFMKLFNCPIRGYLLLPARTSTRYIRNTRAPSQLQSFPDTLPSRSSWRPSPHHRGDPPWSLALAGVARAAEGAAPPPDIPWEDAQLQVRTQTLHLSPRDPDFIPGRLTPIHVEGPEDDTIAFEDAIESAAWGLRPGDDRHI